MTPPRSVRVPSAVGSKIFVRSWRPSIMDHLVHNLTKKFMRGPSLSLRESSFVHPLRYWRGPEPAAHRNLRRERKTPRAHRHPNQTARLPFPPHTLLGT